MKARTLGILGGGQLAQMIAAAALPLGIRTVVLEPDPQAPARWNAEQLPLPYTDPAGLERLAACDAVTLEFENVPTEATEALEGRVPLRPSPAVLHRSKHRAREKAALVQAGASVAPYRVIEQAEDLPGALSAVGGQGLLKTSELGYDGKGQQTVTDEAGLRAAWERLERVPCVLEGLVPFVREVSLGVARGPGGELAYGPLVENLHRGGILRRSVYPAASPDATAQAARRIARQVVEGWDVTGLITLEFFELESGELLVNEVAPRVHNSGHLTQDGGGLTQFEVAARAALGLPLRDFEPLLPCAMVNLLGWPDGEEPDLEALLHLPGVHLHLYHKQNRVGRKLGHVNVVGHSREEVLARAAEVEQLIGRP
ncbi:5-(carboxyamino)imidazole ribonucleotide synthase [Deinococcus sonorensis]|uniref:N5-carboxyaminoimidazole ribonucleotide synthase n=2 Tax=Deinococcus sonorensis TaxID=309891 RepID=A0AAU7UFI0_9DEIO